MRSVVWFRGKDLRVDDHAALSEAARSGEVIPVFISNPRLLSPKRARAHAHRSQFLLDALAALDDQLTRRGAPLLVASGDEVELLPTLVERLRADRVLAHRVVEPLARERSRRLAEQLGERLVLMEGETLLAPGRVRTRSGKPYSVFTPFSRAFDEVFEPDPPLPAPSRLRPHPTLAGQTRGLPLIELPTRQSLGLPANPRVLPAAAPEPRRRLDRFVAQSMDDYAEQRDRLDLAGTSRLSQDLKFGTLSVRQVMSAVRRPKRASRGRDAFERELVWREFAHDLLWERPWLLERPFRSEFADFPWRDSDEHWNAWAEGNTGYPVIDAAMRQLRLEGFMPNRARMLTASFLTKHLLIDYRRGEAHFMRYLTDGDWAQNNAGWQWSAGCGCDAQPYFRVFNPTTQGKEFDPEGNYVRQYVEELRTLPTRFIHAPWDAPAPKLASAGVRLGSDYPYPIVEHRGARERFLELAALHLRR